MCCSSFWPQWPPEILLIVTLHASNNYCVRRLCTCRKNALLIQIGVKIVWDSQPINEWKEHTELYNILKFGVNQANIRRDTAIQKLQFLPYEIHTDAGQIIRRVRLSIHFLVNLLKFLNGRISFNIGPNPTKLEDFVKLGILFLAVGVLCPLSHNTQTRTQSPTI